MAAGRRCGDSERVRDFETSDKILANNARCCVGKRKRDFVRLREAVCVQAASAGLYCRRFSINCLKQGSMKEVPLTKGMFAFVDDEDFFKLKKGKWHARIGRKTAYAGRVGKKDDGESRIVLMHRAILKLTDEPVCVDHIDGNGLNNQKSNLRICSAQQNLRNSGLRRDNSTGYKGVSFSISNKGFMATIRYNNKKIYLGTFLTPEEAARAYDEAAKRLHGEFARTNFSD